MDNSSAPGIDVGGRRVRRRRRRPAPAKQATHEKPAKEKVLGGTPKDNPDDDNCTEAPSKPAPLTRPSEIEYTQEARANGIEGRLILRITVGADGIVTDVEVQGSVDAGARRGRGRGGQDVDASSRRCAAASRWPAASSRWRAASSSETDAAPRSLRRSRS